MTCGADEEGTDVNDPEYWIELGRKQRDQIAKRETYREYKVVDACSPNGTLGPDDCMKNKVPATTIQVLESRSRLIPVR